LPFTPLYLLSIPISPTLIDNPSTLDSAQLIASHGWIFRGNTLAANGAGADAVDKDADGLRRTTQVIPYSEQGRAHAEWTLQ
jgi:hypothetical protein